MRKLILALLLAMGCAPMITARGAQNVAGARWVKPAIEEIFPGVWRVRFGTPERFTPDSLREAPPSATGFTNLPAAGTPLLNPAQIRCRISPSRTTIYVPFEDKGQKIYGFGLDPGAYEQNGLCKTLSVCAAVVGKTGASHGPVPFYLSTAGYGVYVDTARVPTVQVARLVSNQSSIPEAATANQPSASETELYAPRLEKGKKEVVFELPGDSTGVDVYLFGGPSIREAVERYNLFSGGGAVPPLWGLGLKFRTYTKADEATVLKAARSIREMKIPCDMIGLEPGWQSKAYSCSFTWSKERFPEVDAMIKELRDSGFKINLWEHAYVHPTSPMFQPLKAHAGDWLVWGGLVVDFADPSASQVFTDFHDHELVSRGIMGFKGDECDRQPPTDATPFNYPYSTIFPSGIDGDQMTQVYGYLYQRSLFGAFKAHNLRTWGDVRATASLASPLPFNLYSDAYSFEEYLRQLVNASFTGLLWSPEVRHGGTREEFMNRLALSALAPQMCLDMWFMPNPVWEQFDRNKNERNELLPEAEKKAFADQMRTIVNQRYELIPYLYASFQKYRQQGLPPVRSLLLDFPADTNLWEVDDAFMFGDNLLVAPFLGTSTSRSVILPAGVDWYELNTKRWHPGGTTVVATGSPGQIPLFVKENSLLPMAEPVQEINPDTVFKVTVKAFGEHPAALDLYEDDGVSFDFQNGAQTKVALNWTAANGGTVERTGKFPTKRYDIVKWEAIAKTNP